MIPTELYNDYTTALEENDRQAKAALAAIMAQLDPSDAGAVLETLLEAYPALVALYGTRAAQVALEFYMGVRAAQEVESAFNAIIPPMDDETMDVYTTDVYREVNSFSSGNKSYESLESTLQGLATKRIMQMSDKTLFALANADPAHPKVALVPHPGACAWCVLIGSRGFTNSESAMDHMRHDGCKCATVVDFDRDNPALPGYDPDDYYAAYADVANDETFQKMIYEEWQNMPESERAKYVKKSVTKAGESKEHVGDWSTYARNRTLQEMNVNLGNTKTSRISAAKEKAGKE